MWVNKSRFPSHWPYKVRSWLVLRSTEAKTQEVTGRVLGWSCAYVQWVSSHKSRRASGKRRWHSERPSVWLVLLFPAIFPFNGISSLHHLAFSSAAPGKVVVKVWCDAEEKILTLLAKCQENWHWDPKQLPQVIVPPGLSYERQIYLYDKIRDFVPDISKDIVCPPPHILNTEETHSSSSSPSPSPSPPSSSSPSPSPSPPPSSL